MVKNWSKTEFYFLLLFFKEIQVLVVCNKYANALSDGSLKMNKKKRSLLFLGIPVYNPSKTYMKSVAWVAPPVLRWSTHKWVWLDVIKHSQVLPVFYIKNAQISISTDQEK